MYGKRALIVTSTNEGVSAVSGFIRSCGCSEICTAANGGEARRLMSCDSFDLMIINMPLSDEKGDRLAQQISASTSAGIILLCKADSAEEITNRTADSGVSVVSKPIHKSELYQAVRAGFAMRTRLLSLRDENEKLRQKLRELRVVSRAKCLLIEKCSMTEQDAHRHIEKLAMDSRRTREAVAEETIAAHS